MDEFDLQPSDFKGPTIAIKNHLKMNKFQANNFLSVKEQHYCHNVMSSYEKQDMAVVHRHHINMYLRDLKLSKQTRWSDFKQRRKEIIEKYLVVKRRSMAMSIVVRQAGIY